MIDNFKGSEDFGKELRKEVITFLEKGCIHIIRQLHPYFEDKSVLLQAFKANFDNEACHKGADFVPYTTEELDALHDNDLKDNLPEWIPPPVSHPSFSELLEGPEDQPPRNPAPSKV